MMFTKRGKRFIIRGVGRELKVDAETYDAIMCGAYGRRSGHTHPPGYDIDASMADRATLGALGQERSAVWGDGGYRVFGLTRPDDARHAENIRRARNARLYGAAE